MNNRVVITGMDVIASNGANVNEFWSNCLSGKVNVQNIPAKWLDYANYNSTIWSPLPNLDTGDGILTDIEKGKLDKSSVLAVMTAAGSLKNAGIDYCQLDKKKNTFVVNGVDKNRFGIYLGTGVGGINTLLSCASHHMLEKSKSLLTETSSALQKANSECGREREIAEQISRINSRHLLPFRFNPFVVSMLMPNATASNIGIKFGICGPTRALCSSCASGTVAIGNAFRDIQRGVVDIALAGGVEYLNDDYGIIFHGFDVAKTLAQDIAGKQNIDELNRPFDAQRTGFLFSEGGCGIIVLETLESAQKRGASIICEIVGYNETSDAHSIMMIEPNGFQIIQMLEKLLEDCNVDAVDIDYVNAHGTGTALNDKVESAVIQNTFGNKVLVNSTKSIIGHTIGASGAIEAIVSALSIKHQTTHVCLNLQDPIADLNFVRRVDNFPIKSAVSQSFGFGGHNACLLLKQFQSGSI